MGPWDAMCGSEHRNLVYSYSLKRCLSSEKQQQRHVSYPPAGQQTLGRLSTDPYLTSPLLSYHKSWGQRQHRNFIHCLWDVTFGLHQNHRQLVGNLWLCIFDLKLWAHFKLTTLLSFWFLEWFYGKMAWGHLDSRRESGNVSQKVGCCWEGGWWGERHALRQQCVSFTEYAPVLMWGWWL